MELPPGDPDLARGSDGAYDWLNHLESTMEHHKVLIPAMAAENKETAERHS